MEFVYCTKSYEKDGEPYGEFENGLVQALVTEMDDMCISVDELDSKCCFDLRDDNYATMDEGEENYIKFKCIGRELFRVSIERFKEEYKPI